jgi:hypothetical protein
MFVARGNNPASTSNSLPVFITEYGQVFTAFRENDFFCIGCNFTVFVEAPKNALVMLTAKSSKTISNIHLGREYFDAMYRGLNITYILNTTQENIKKTPEGFINETLYFFLLASHGDPDLFVTCGKELPATLEQYRWKIDGRGVETLIISREEFLVEFGPNQCDSIIVTVYARVCAAYGLLVICLLIKILLGFS